MTTRARSGSSRGRGIGSHSCESRVGGLDRRRRVEVLLARSRRSRSRARRSTPWTTPQAASRASDMIRISVSAARWPSVGPDRRSTPPAARSSAASSNSLLTARLPRSNIRWPMPAYSQSTSIVPCPGSAAASLEHVRGAAGRRGTAPDRRAAAPRRSARPAPVWRRTRPAARRRDRATIARVVVEQLGHPEARGQRSARVVEGAQRPSHRRSGRPAAGRRRRRLARRGTP